MTEQSVHGIRASAPTSASYTKKGNHFKHNISSDITLFPLVKNEFSILCFFSSEVTLTFATYSVVNAFFARLLQSCRSGNSEKLGNDKENLNRVREYFRFNKFVYISYFVKIIRWSLENIVWLLISNNSANRTVLFLLWTILSIINIKLKT